MSFLGDNIYPTGKDYLNNLQIPLWMNYASL